MIANCFNPRTPCGVRPGAGRILFFHAGFNPRTPCGVRQVASGKGFPFLRFNPRTPCGVRRVTFQHTAETRPFQSTHSLRSATSIRSRLLSLCVVSIHALLAECDQIRVQDIPGIRPFQSTHSLRSATRQCHSSHLPTCVSIHALLAECDNSSPLKRYATLRFNPRTPCGVRRTTKRNTKTIESFNPRTPCGVRPEFYLLNIEIFLFQSTHSLRSATQPTLYITTQQSKSYFAPTSLKRPSLHGYTF